MQHTATWCRTQARRHQAGSFSLRCCGVSLAADKNPDNAEATERFQQLGQAYQVGCAGLAGLAAVGAPPCCGRVGRLRHLLPQQVGTTAAASGNQRVCVPHVAAAQPGLNLWGLAVGAAAAAAGFQVLSNAELRAKYDKYGSAGLDVEFADPSMIFGMLFGSELFEPIVGEFLIAAATSKGRELTENEINHMQV